MGVTGNPAPVIIAFETRGDRDVMRAFDTLENRMARFERAGAGAAARGARERAQGTKKEADTRQADYARMFAAIDKKEKDASRAAAQEAKRRESIVKNSSAMTGRLAKQQADTEIREARKASRELERIEQMKMRIRIRSSEMAGRIAVQQVRAEGRARQQFIGNAGSAVPSMFGRAFGMAGSAAIGAATIGGGLAIGAGIRSHLSAEHAAAGLVNSATVGGKAQDGATTANILARAKTVSAETGTDKTALIGAVQNYVAKAGADKFGSGMENMGFFARMAKSSGAKLEDITGAAGILQAQNKNLKPDEMRQMLLDLQEQGKQGAVEIQDMAHLSGVLGSTRGLYAGNMADNQRKLLGLAQFTMPEGGSADEAAMAVKHLGEDAVKPQHRWKAKELGIKFNSSGEIENIEQMITAVVGSTKGDVSKAMGVFGERGVKTFQHFGSTFKEAEKAKKGSGIDAVKAEMATVLGAKGSEAQMNAQYNEMMKTDSEQLGLAFHKIQDAAEGAVLPALQSFVKSLPNITPKAEALIAGVGKMATSFIENPIEGVLLAGAVKMGGAIGGLASAITAGMLLINAIAEEDLAKQRKSSEDVAHSGDSASRLLHGMGKDGDVEDAYKRLGGATITKAFGEGEVKKKENRIKQMEEDLALETKMGLAPGSSGTNQNQIDAAKKDLDETRNTFKNACADVDLFSAAIKAASAAAASFKGFVGPPGADTSPAPDTARTAPIPTG